jgi:hypothetical protein
MTKSSFGPLSALQLDAGKCADRRFLHSKPGPVTETGSQVRAPKLAVTQTP